MPARLSACRLLAFVGAWLLCASAVPADPARLGVASGLPAERVTSVLQDRHGFVWVGTEEGMVRWDGHRLRRFNHAALSSQTLPSDRVRTLFESRSGHLWVGTDQGLARFEREMGYFRPVPLAASTSAGSATRPPSSGCFEAAKRRISSSCIARSAIGVRVSAGATTLKRMLFSA